ncbi:MAG: diacylglycerol kinase [Dehalococcoidia bacterium]|nr:MAG: diacylglycerol kinase [Dehalococcoidia bacterium]
MPRCIAPDPTAIALGRLDSERLEGRSRPKERVERAVKPYHQDSAIEDGGHAPAKRAFVVLNPVGGSSDPAFIRSTVETAFGDAGWDHCIYETTGNDDFAAVVGGAVREGFDLVVAAGGDGTVSLVAGPLIGADVPLGILPVGTANVLSRELGIPADLQQAAALFTGDHSLRAVDVMQVGNRYALLQVGIGLDSLMIRDTDRETKRRIGRRAYLQTLWEKLRGHRSQRFTVVVDSERLRPIAWQVLVANAGTLGVRPLRWGPNIRLDDGELDVCLFYGRTIANLGRQIRYLISRGVRGADFVRYRKARHSVSIVTDPPLPVQADGEITGTTPVTVALLPHALRIVVPAENPR